MGVYLSKYKNKKHCTIRYFIPQYVQPNVIAQRHKLIIYFKASNSFIFTAKLNMFITIKSTKSAF